MAERGIAMSEQLLNEILSEIKSIKTAVQSMDARLGNIERRLGGLDERLDKLDSRLESAEGQLSETNQIVKVLRYRSEEADAQLFRLGYALTQARIPG